MARELVYDFRAVGAEETAAKVRALNEEFKRGGISLEDYGKKKRELRADARAYADTFRLETQLWMAAHPNVEKLTRAVSVMSSVMNTALAVQNALNLAMLVQQGQQASLIEATAAVAQAERELLIARQSGDPVTIADAEDKLRIARARQSEQTQQTQQAEQGRVTSLVTGLGLLAGQAVMTAVTIAAHWAGISSALGGVAGAFGSIGAEVTGLFATFSLLGPAAAAAAGAIVGFFTAQFLNENTVWYHQYAIGMTNFFYKTIPQALAAGIDFLTKFFTGSDEIWGNVKTSLAGAWDFIRSGFLGFWNGLVGVANAGIRALASGFSGLANMAIDSVNGTIAGINKLVEWTGISLNPVAHVSLAIPTIPTISAMTGFEGRLPRDTVFQAHAGEHVSITPVGGASIGGGGGGNTYVTVQGNLWTTRELLDELDQWRQRGKRDRM